LKLQIPVEVIRKHSLQQYALIENMPARSRYQSKNSAKVNLLKTGVIQCSEIISSEKIA
jgi:hypothetical protein